MDYGPFGWMEEYNPLFAKWTGSGQHFGFMNQPNAAFANYNVLVSSVVPVICAADGSNKDRDQVAKPFLEKGARIFEKAVEEMFRVKLGFKTNQDVGDDIFESLEPLMRKSRVDYTILFRQLTNVVRDFSKESDRDYEAMFALIEGNKEDQKAGLTAFYEPLTDELRDEWLLWLQQWRQALVACGSLETAYERMRTANPKFVLREWMLADAYTDAANNQEAELFKLHDLIQRPYDEGSDKETERYYRRAPEEALTKGGIGFMS